MTRFSGTDETINLSVYRKPEVVACFTSLDSLTPCEKLLFDTYLKRGSALLDLGVGGGRTTPYLASIASDYVGVDYSEEMVCACRAKYPNLKFELADAADLSLFADNSFDGIIFSYNGIDNLAPDNNRQTCLRECHRILKPGGVLIFSSHNPRSLIVGWDWDQSRLRIRAERISASSRVPFPLVLAGVSFAKLGLELLRSSSRSIPRAFRRIPTRTFWTGEGYLLDPTHGGLWTHCGTPTRVIAELNEHRFKFLQELPEDYPRPSWSLSTRWYYYAFSKS